MNQLETFWVDDKQFNYARFHQYIFDRNIDRLNDVLDYCRDNPSLSIQQDAYTGNFIFQIRARRMMRDVVDCQNNLLGIQVTLIPDMMRHGVDRVIEAIDKAVEKFCELVSSVLRPVLDFWIRYDSIWEKYQFDWRPTESIAEDYYCG